MTMHMVGPYLTTTGKKAGKHKFRSAEHKRQAEIDARAWDELQKKYATKSKPVLLQKVSEPAPYRRDTGPRIPSKPDTIAVAVKKPIPQYTRTNMTGIGQLHKSNAIPVFRQSDAEDISKMRRG